jgi:hypothetical protein
MNEILELQTGQVSFISGLMAGFSLSVAVQIFRSRTAGPLATTCFVLFTVTSLLFLLALYIDVALSLRTAGIEQFPPDVLKKITDIRTIGTSAATIALFLFVTSIGLIGWLQSRIAGIITAVVALLTVIVIWVARSMIFSLGIVA